MATNKLSSVTISLRIPQEIYAELYKRKGKVEIKSLQDFIIQAIEEKLGRKGVNK